MLADSVFAEEINNTGVLTVDAPSIAVEKINLSDNNNTLTLTGGVSTNLITGEGELDVQRIGELDGRPIEVEGKPTIVSDLMIDSNSAIDIDENAILHVTGEIRAWGDLTLTGTGELSATGELTVEKALSNENKTVKVENIKDIHVDTPPLGEQPNLVLHVSPGNSFSMETIGEGWKTVTVTGGGTLSVDNVTAVLKEVILEGGSTLESVGDLKSVTISGNGTLKAKNIDVTTVESEGGEILTFNTSGTVTVTEVTGSGTVAVDGSVKVDNLSIANDATLEASSLIIDGDKVEIGGGGLLKVNANLTLKDVDLTVGSQLEIAGDLTFEDKSSVSFGDDATLVVDGSVTAVGNLNFSGDGTLNVAGDLLVDNGVLTASADHLDISGDISALTLSPEVGEDLKVAVKPGKILTVPNLEGEETVSVTGGGTLKVSQDTTLKKVELESGSILEVDGILSGEGVAGIEISGNGTVIAESIASKKLASDGNQTITADQISIDEIEASAGKIVTLNGAVTTEKISGSGTVVVKDSLLADDLKVSGSATLDLGASGWNAVNFEAEGKITLSGNADLKINGQSIKWYTLYGAEAQYYKANDIQLRFLQGGGAQKVTPAKVSAVPTETITHVGSGVLFEVTTMNRLNLAAKELVLEDGSFTLIAQNWWTSGNSIALGSGTITVDAGATVKYGNDVTWIGSAQNDEFVLTGSAQMKYSSAKGTEILNAATSGTAQLNLKDWKSGSAGRQLNHVFTIAENVTLLLGKSHFLVGNNGKIVVEEGGKLEIQNGNELQTEEVNQLIVRGEVVVNDGATINLKDGMFIFDEKNEKKLTGSVLLKAGSIWMAAGTVYYAPSSTTTGRRAISFNTDGVDLEFTPYSKALGVRKYKITGAGGKRTFSINYSGSGINSGSQIITVGDNAILELNKSFDIAPSSSSNSSITVENGGTLKVNSGSILTTGDTNRTVKIESGGKLENDGTININGSGRLDIAGEVTVYNRGIIRSDRNSGITFSSNNAVLTIEPGAKITLPNNVWTASGGIGSQGKVVIEGGGILTYGPKGGDETNWFGGVGSQSFFNLESNVQATLQGGATAAARSTTFSRITSSSSDKTSVFVQGIRNPNGRTNVLTPSGNMVIDGVEFTIVRIGEIGQEFGNNGNLEVKNNGLLVINGSYGIGAGKTVTIRSGSTLEIAQSGVIREVTTNKVGGGTFDIKTGGIVKIAGVTRSANVAATYSGKVTNHTVKYNGTQVFKHP